MLKRLLKRKQLIVNKTGTEKAALNGSLTTFGGLTWETPSNFPARGLVVTS